MKVLLSTFILISTICFAQKQYEFDYLIEYELTFYKDSIKIKNRPFREKDETIKKLYLTNSKQNNYIVELTELDSLNYKMIFTDYNGIYSDVLILKTDLITAEFINIDCKYVNRFSDRFNYKKKYYDFLNLNDTLINGKSYGKYKIESNNPKRTKKIKIGTEFYIINQQTTFHLPIFTLSTAYAKWKTEGNLPLGIYFEKYFIDYYGYLSSKEKLKNYWKIDKKIVLNDECNYTVKK